MANCTECGKPVVLVPSAEVRAKKYGGKPADYIAMFPRHAQCEIKKRNADLSVLIRSTQK